MIENGICINFSLRFTQKKKTPRLRLKKKKKETWWGRGEGQIGNFPCKLTIREITKPPKNVGLGRNNPHSNQTRSFSPSFFPSYQNHLVLVKARDALKCVNAKCLLDPRHKAQSCAWLKWSAHLKKKIINEKFNNQTIKLSYKLKKKSYNSYNI